MLGPQEGSKTFRGGDEGDDEREEASPLCRNVGEGEGGREGSEECAASGLADNIATF